MEGGNIFVDIARGMKADFDLFAHISHAGERGSEVENILRSFLKRYLPGRFGVGTGFVIGKSAKESRQCDIVIYDALDTPRLLVAEEVALFPLDCVVAVIEVKSYVDKEELLGNKKKRKVGALRQVASVRELKYQQPLRTDFRDSKPLGMVFAFSASTQLSTLATHVREFRDNPGNNAGHMANCVCVVDKGLICYLDKAKKWFHMDPTLGHPVIAVEAGEQALAIWYFFLLERMVVLLENRIKAKTERQLLRSPLPFCSCEADRGSECARYSLLLPNMVEYFNLPARFCLKESENDVFVAASVDSCNRLTLGG